jgi:hypothetical protein
MPAYGIHPGGSPRRNNSGAIGSEQFVAIDPELSAACPWVATARRTSRSVTIPATAARARPRCSEASPPSSAKAVSKEKEPRPASVDGSYFCDRLPKTKLDARSTITISVAVPVATISIAIKPALAPLSDTNSHIVIVESVEASLATNVLSAILATYRRLSEPYANVACSADRQGIGAPWQEGGGRSRQNEIFTHVWHGCLKIGTPG